MNAKKERNKKEFTNKLENFGPLNLLKQIDLHVVLMLLLLVFFFFYLICILRTLLASVIDLPSYLFTLSSLAI